MRFKEFKEAIAPLGNKDGAPGAPATKNKPLEKELLTVGPPFPAGDSEAVKQMQKGLTDLGYTVGNTGVDGKFGPNTAAAVEAFKKDYKLPGDGKTFASSDLDVLKKVQAGSIPKVATPTPVVPPKAKIASVDTPVEVPGSTDAKAIKKVINAGPGYTDVQTVDGEVFRRQGVRNWRNNNPGNLEFGSFARSRGAVGSDGRFAVFPTLEAGLKAKEDLVFGPRYINLSIRNAISKYAPESENDVNMYVSQVVAATNADQNTILKDLSDSQRTAMLNTINRVEGFKPGQVVALSNIPGSTATA
jgi:peptidoglycan hydrolase-like protein with peptidoglycan-binding domain